MAEPVSALRDLDELSGYTEQNPLSVGDDQQKAIQELERRGIKAPEQPEFGYDYGGDRGVTDIFMPFRREVIRPEQTIPTGNISFGPRGNMQQEVKTIPAQYGESEFGMEYMPLVRGTKSALNAVGDFFFGDAGEQAAVTKSALNMAEGLGQYATEQAKAAASGGEYYDPEQQRIVSFDPTSVMIGGNPTAGQAVLASGVRLPSGGKKRAYEQYGGTLNDAREKLGITQEGTDAWRSTRKGFKSEIPQEIREAAQKVYDGDMDIQEYNNIVQRVLPPEPIGQVLEVPSYEEIAMALGKGEKTGGIIGVNIALPDGTPASSRLDINAYQDQGTWVATVHDAGTSGTVLGYGPTAVLNNVSFNSKPNVALDIARGAKTKSTIGRVEGAWENRDPKVVEQQVRDILNGTAPDADQWIEVGMNPARGSGFYDKKNGQRLGEAEQILQIGPVVLAKRATRIELDDPRNLLTTRGKPKLNDQGEQMFFAGDNRVAGSGAISALREQFNISDEGFDPRFDKRIQEQDRILNTELVYDNRNFEKPELSIFDFEGRPFALTMSDRTKAGSQLRGVEGIQYDIPIDLQGGQDFMFANPLGREGQVWAQDQGATSGYLNALKLGGRPFNNDEVLMLPYRMAPTGGDFATMTGEVMVTHARHAVPKTMKTKADRKIREFYPSWKGIDDPESIKQISEMSGDPRKKLLNVLDIGLRNEGGLGIGQARLAVSDRMQFNAPDMGLQNVGFLNPLGGRFEVSGHRTYGQGLAGRGGGVLREQDINAFELLPEFAQQRGFNSVDDLLRADPSTMAKEQYTLRRLKPMGTITEDILKGIEQRRN